jgi:hypothetical protein
MHAYIHAYTHTHIHKCMHTCIHTYIHTCIHTKIKIARLAQSHHLHFSHIHTYTKTYIHTLYPACGFWTLRGLWFSHIHTYANTYIHTHTQLAALGPNVVIFNFISYTFTFMSIATTLSVSKALADVSTFCVYSAERACVLSYTSHTLHANVNVFEYFQSACQCGASYTYHLSISSHMISCNSHDYLEVAQWIRIRITSQNSHSYLGHSQSRVNPEDEWHKRFVRNIFVIWKTCCVCTRRILCMYVCSKIQRRRDMLFVVGMVFIQNRHG